MARKRGKPSVPVPVAANTTFDYVNSQLANYFAHNPHSSLDAVPPNLAQDQDQPVYLIRRPWGDDSVGFLIARGGNDRLIATLNNVYLPERFTALWHLDTARFEIIFTADPLPPIWGDLPTRSFKFVHKGKEYQCAFGESSKRLQDICTRALPQRPSRTGYRNLMSFQRHFFGQAKVGGVTKQPGSSPYSFWIDGIEWDEDKVLDLAHHLNFYMSYYDNISPVIVVHTPESEAAASRQQERFAFGQFPTTIAAQPLDDNLIHFWIASREGDPVRRFLYSYQILENAALYFIEDTVKRSIRRIIATPHISDNLDKCVQSIIEVRSKVKFKIRKNWKLC